MKPRIVVLSLLCIVLLGLSLRLHDLPQESLWADETFTLRYAQLGTPSEIWTAITTTEGAPIGHYLLLHYWIQLFGNSEFSARLPSVIFGMLSIILIFLLGRKLLNEATGLFAASFLATSMLQVLYSQEARLYSMFGFLALLSTYFVVLIAENNGQGNSCVKYYLFYGLTITLCAYTNYLTFFLWLFQYLLLAWLLERKEKLLFGKFGFATFSFIIFSLPLLPSFLAQYSVGNSGLAEILLAKGLPAYLATLGIFLYALPLVIIISSGLIVFKYKPKIVQLHRRYFSPDVFAFVLFVFSLCYLYFVTHPISVFGIQFLHHPITHSFFLIRHSFFFAPLFYVALASQIDTLQRQRNNLWAFALLLILLVNVLSLTTYYTQPTKAQWREAVIELKSSPSQLILVDSGGPASMFLLQYYWPELPAENIVQLTQLVGRRGIISLNETKLLEKVHSQSQFWLLLTPSQKKGEWYRQILQQHFREDNSFSLYQLNVYHYTPLPGNGDSNIAP